MRLEWCYEQEQKLAGRQSSGCLSVRLRHHVAFACSVQGERRLQACSSPVLGFVTVVCLVCLFLPARRLSANSVWSEGMKSRGLVCCDKIP
jgi:hypothetical protein